LPNPLEGKRRRLGSAALALAGLVALVVTGFTLSRGGGNAATVRPIDPGAVSRLADASSPVSASATPSVAGPLWTVEPAPTPASAGPGPVRIRIAAVGIDAPVVAVGVDAGGGVQIPAAVHTVGWYRFSPPPGSTAGSTVLVGHVDSAEQGEGAFFNLHQLNKGASIVLDMPGGRAQRYQVISRAQFPKTAVPLAALFATTGAPRLTLITCGGSFDETIRSYRDNVVITAVPR